MTLVAFMTNTKAQQFQPLNGDFESWTGSGSNEVPSNWHTFNQANCTMALGCSSAKGNHHYKRSGHRTGGSGSYFVELYTKSILGIKANGNMTTGQIQIGSMTPSSTDNNNKTVRGSYDQPFTATPDSVYFWYSFYAQSASSKASVRVYIHGDLNFVDHVQVDMNASEKYNRKATCSLSKTSSSSGSYTWVQEKLAFVQGSADPRYLLISLASNEVAASGNENDAIAIDDIVFIYSAWATGISFQETPIPGFSKGNFGDYVTTVDYVSDLDNLTPNDFAVTTEVSDAYPTISYVEESGYTYNGRPARRAKIHIVAEDGGYKDYYVVVYALNDDPTYYNISAVADPTVGGTVTMDPDGGSYVENSTVTLTATANTGYYFTQWSDGVTDNPRTVTATGDVIDITYTAQFALQQYTITVNANPAEGGTVIGGGTYNYNSTPNTGYEFVNWNDNNTNASRMVTVTDNTTYTANFQLQTLTLTAVPDDESHGTVTGSGSYTYGTSATVEATPAEDYHFLRWSDGSTDNPHTFTMTQSTTMTAYFEMDEITYYTVTVVPNNNVMGTVSGSGSVREGRTTQISATANTGYHFTQWNDGNTDNPRTVTVTGDVTYTAYFAADTYTITALSADNTMGTVNGGGQYDYATTATLTAVPETGFRFTQWQDGNTQNPRQVSVTGNATYTASFERISFTVTAVANNNQYGTVTGSDTYFYGETATLTATAEDGYHFVQWNNGETANPYSFAVYENTNLIANFEEDGAVIVYYTVTATSANPTMGGVTGGGVYAEGTTATIEAVANTGYEFVEWNDQVTTNPRSFTVTEDVAYTATFQPINYEITVVANPAEGGQVTGGGTYQYGATATLAATPNAGYEFTGWSDGIMSETRSEVVNGNATYTANFTQQEYQINILVSNAAYGTTTGTNTYHYGDQVIATATANQGFRFTQWSNGVTDNPYTFTATGDLNLYAEFVSAAVQFYTVTVASANPEMGGVSGAGSYPEGATVSVEALPNYGYRFTQWQDGETANPRTFVINSDMDFTASFATDNFTVTVAANDANMGTVSGGGTYAYLSQVDLIATPNEGYHFVTWEGTNNINNSKSVSDTLTITVEGNVTVTAIFAEDEVVYYTITVASSNESMGTATGGGIYPAGDTIEIQANPNFNYAFSRWREDGNVDNPRTIVVEGNRTYTAIFQYTGAVNGVPNGHVVAWCQGGRLFVKGVENHDVTVTDMMGRVIYRAEQCLFDDFNIDVKADGVYLVHVDGVATKKVYIRH